MNHPFAVGRGYDRSVLLEFAGSRQGQSGIIWGIKQPDVVICTSGGKHGARAGYADGPNDDGTWTYFGQGEKGNQDPESYANRILISGQRSVLLFLTREATTAHRRARGNSRKLYVFEGEYCVGGWDTLVPSEGSRRGDQVLRFVFVPAASGAAEAPTAIEGSHIPTSELSQLKTLLEEMNAESRRGTVSIKDYFVRSDLLRRYAKGRAQGRCELCGAQAPFVTSAGAPFLEVHHIFRLADDGPDKPGNVAALCPNCHRACHHSVHVEELRVTLCEAIAAKEDSIAGGTVGLQHGSGDVD